jgi:hypothetical protein
VIITGKPRLVMLSGQIEKILMDINRPIMLQNDFVDIKEKILWQHMKK